ncbi:MAG: class I SAM-dependent methyltransferase [Thermoanaerobaculia bacterium]
MTRALQQERALRPAEAEAADGGRGLWPRLRGYGELLRDRASGAAPEMESAKSLCRRLEGRYRPGMSVLDVGCGAGHYLRSLRSRLDPEIDYTGVDLTVSFLALGRRVFPDVPLAGGDAFALPFPDRSFDLVLCSNLLLHLPPPPDRPLAELARVARERLLVRTPVGERNYLVQEVREAEEVAGGGPGGGAGEPRPGWPDESVPGDELFDEAGTPRRFNHFNLYTEEYLTRAARRAAPGARIHLEPDRCFKPFDNRADTTSTGTRVAGGRQVAGNLLLEWAWLEVERSA